MTTFYSQKLWWLYPTLSIYSTSYRNCPHPFLHLIILLYTQLLSPKYVSSHTFNQFFTKFYSYLYQKVYSYQGSFNTIIHNNHYNHSTTTTSLPPLNHSPTNGISWRNLTITFSPPMSKSSRFLPLIYLESWGDHKTMYWGLTSSIGDTIRSKNMCVKTYCDHDMEKLLTFMYYVWLKKHVNISDCMWSLPLFIIIFDATQFCNMYVYF